MKTRFDAPTEVAECHVAMPARAVVDEVHAIVERNPHFRRHTNEIVVEFDGHTLVLTGRLPSFYLKQMLQESLRDLEGVAKIDNRVDVVCCDGLSSIQRLPR